MDGDLITVKALINGVLFKPILINIDYECYSIVDKNLIIKLWLPRIKIPSKLIICFFKENIKEPGVEITEIAKFSINIQEYRRNIFTYIVLILLNPVMIRLPWIRQDIIISPVIDTLIINSYGLTISTKIILISLEIKELMATPFIILVKRARKRKKPLTVFKVLLKNITKLLCPKVIRIPAEIRRLLPTQYYNYLPLFEGDMAAELPLHRPGINHIFTLEKTKNG